MLSTNNMNFVEKMNTSSLARQANIIESSEYWGDVGLLLSEKDKKLADLALKLEAEIKVNTTQKKTIKDVI